MTHRRRDRASAAAQRGAALLLAMVIVVLVVTAAAGMVWQQSRAVAIESAERARTQAAWILNGALDWARLILREDLRETRQRGAVHDSLDEPWATPLAEARLSTFLAADQDNNAEGGLDAFISGAISDAQSRFNLTGVLDAAGKPVAVQVAALERLCAAAGTAADTAARIVGALQASRPSAAPGADGDAGLPLTRLRELAWLGIDSITLERLAPFVDVLPTATAVNVNTAPREVLVAAIDGIDLGTAERLVQRRQRSAFRQLADVGAELPPGTALDAARIGVGSSHFEVAGRLRLEERVLEERSLLVRSEGRVDVLRRERRSFTAGGG